MFRLLHYEHINLIPREFLNDIDLEKTCHRITLFFLLKTEPNFLSAMLTGADKQSLGMCDRARSSKSFILCLNVKTIRAKQAKVHFAISDNVTNME